MIITNITKGTVLASNSGLARTMFERMKGLLGRDGLAPGEGLVIMPCTSIHTIGMRFPIDTVFFDKNRRAIAVIQNMRPGRLSAWHIRAKGVVELPAGALIGSPVEIGDKLDFSGMAV